MTSIVGGRLLVRFARYKRVPLAGLLLTIAALVPLALAPTGFSPAVALGLIALAGFGHGPDVPVYDRGGAKRGRTASAGRRDRHDEFLSRARLDLHRHRIRGHRAGGRPAIRGLPAASCSRGRTPPRRSAGCSPRRSPASSSRSPVLAHWRSGRCAGLACRDRARARDDAAAESGMAAHTCSVPNPIASAQCGSDIGQSRGAERPLHCP